MDDRTSHAASSPSRTDASPKTQFLGAYDREHAITMRVLRAFPADQGDFRPHPKCRTARELAWIFVLERGLGTAIWNDVFASRGPSGKPPEPPQNWADIINGLEKAHNDFKELIRSTPDQKLFENVHFFVGPKTMGEMPRIDWLWFLLSDEVHHRGQLSVYLRAVGAKVPSIYGPSGDEPWI